MNGSAETKVCPFCAETIKAAAKLCPFCQHRQSRFVLLQKDIATVFVGLLLVLCCVAFAVWADSASNPVERNFADHREDLEVLRTSIERARQTPETWLAGLDTNVANQKLLASYLPPRSAPSKIPASLEVRFIDSDGNLLQEHEVETNVILVQPDLWLTGFITNKGAKPWRVDDLEMRFFERGTNLVAVQHLNLDHSPLVAPHKESAFRVILGKSTPTNSEASFSVRVQRATEPNMNNL